ncbi:uncharacterized protein [Rutidosis leptorrhynchoides]|uniref:uncharacterized protein n=1 Tax=Rutidosis leptorrhynchoides TaxID=125765 RepID=UPI003A99AB02
MAKWAVKLGEHEINFSSRSAVKGQILADYLAEIPADVEASAEHQDPPAPVLSPWELYTDGACSASGAGAGVILTGPGGEEHTYALRFNFAVTNNEAEYEALLAGMRIAHKLNVKILHAYVDSKLVCNQVCGDFEAHDIAMQQYLSLVHNLADQFEAFQISHVMRGQNKKADALSKLAALAFDHMGKKILIEELNAKSIVMMPLVAPVEESSPTWMTPIIAFLRDGTSPADSSDAKKVRTKAPLYALEGDVLYRRNYLGPHLRCVGPKEAEEVIREVHEGACALHSGHRSIVSKIMRLGYYWPTMYADTARIVKQCESCQIHAPISRAPAHPMIPVSSPWPFCKWAIDIVGPFPKGQGNVKFLIVAIDYFTKWVEAKPLATISGKRVRNFVWEDIVCRFGIPNEIVSDNGTQFAGDPFRSWCAELNIKQTFTSVAHPQANGQCEVTNRDIVAGIKARLGHDRVGWVDELPKVLWAHRTTPKASTGETPFSLVYGSEAVVPAEIGNDYIRFSGTLDSSIYTSEYGRLI